MISVSGLSRKEVAFLDILYSLETLEEVNMWKSTLPSHDQLVCDSLIQLIVLECLDDTILNEQDTKQAHRIINEIVEGYDDLH